MEELGDGDDDACGHVVARYGSNESNGSFGGSEDASAHYRLWRFRV